MIKYRLVDDPENPGMKKAEVILEDEIDIEDIAANTPGGLMMKQRSQEIIHQFFKAAMEIAAVEGDIVDLGYLIIQPVGERNEDGLYEVEIIPGEKMQEAISKADVQMVDENYEPDPIQIKTVLDVLTDSENASITPGGLVEIRGKHLKIRPLIDNPEKEGVYFAYEGKDTMLHLDKIQINTVNNLTIELPEEMEEGVGHFIVKSGMFNDPAKQRRAGISKQLTVKKMNK